MTDSRTPLSRRVLAATAVTAALVLPAAPAFAHVTVSPDTTEAESYASLTFRVPTESDTESTTQLVVDLPTDTPFLGATPRVLPGWDVEVATGTPDEPIELEGATVDDAPVRAP